MYELDLGWSDNSRWLGNGIMDWNNMMGKLCGGDFIVPVEIF
jgi:hypothetical protein